MTVSSVYDAKTHLSELIRKAIDGEEVVISKSGKPVVRIVPYESKSHSVKLGLLRGQIKIADDFDDFSGDIEEMFKGYIPEE